MPQKLDRVANSAKSITLADSPYTLIEGHFNVIDVNTAGGNVRVNLPNADYPIKVNKTSGDSYLVTLYVAGTQIGEIAGERSSVTVEAGQITKDEPWYPYDMIVGIAGVSGDGGEVIAKNKYGKCLSSSWRGVAGTADSTVTNVAIAAHTPGTPFKLKMHGTFKATDEIVFTDIPYVSLDCDGCLESDGLLGTEYILAFKSTSIYTNQKHDIRIAKIDGNREANGILMQNGYANVIHGIDFQSCLNAMTIKNVNTWSELNVVRECTFTDNTIGVNFEPGATSSYYSFVNTQLLYNGFNVGSGTISNAYGVYIPTNAKVENATWIGNRFWTKTVDGTAIAIYLAGSMNRSGLNGLVIENFDPTGVTGISFAAGCTTPSILNYETYQSLGGGAVAISSVDPIPSICNFLPVSRIQHTVSADGTYLILAATAINGIYSIEWISSGRNHKLLFSAQAHAYSTGTLTKISEHIYNSQPVIDDVRLLKKSDSSKVYLAITLGNRNGSGTFAISNFESHYGQIGPNWYVPLVAPAGTETQLAIFYDGLYKGSGSSTGTGSEQTIAHGLAAIPTGCKAWITYLVGSRYVTEFVPFDATNIYPTVTSSLAYTWGIGAV
jgi:hypothetical protein